MRRFLVLAILALNSCDSDPVEWTDEAGIEACEYVLDTCGHTCLPDDLHPRCADTFVGCDGHAVADSGVIELHPGLLARMSEHVALGHETDCKMALQGIDAWRFE